MLYYIYLANYCRIVTQSADSSLFTNVAKDNFMNIFYLGRISKEQKGMLLAGEEISDKIYKPGEGCLLADGHPLYEVAFPKIKDVNDWKKHIIKVLKRNMQWKKVCKKKGNLDKFKVSY